MRSRTIIFTAAVASAAALIAGGVYYYIATTAPDSAGASAPIPASAAGGAEGERAFSLHEQPEPVPELQFVDGAGHAMTLADFRGKTVLLNLWATWCVPCREEMPALDRLQAKLGSPEFEVVPLSIDRGGLATVESFYRELGLTALAVYVDDSGKAAQQLSAVGIPTTLLINREGQEVGRLVGPAEWDAPAAVTVIRNLLRTRPDSVRAHHHDWDGLPNAKEAQSPPSPGSRRTFSSGRRQWLRSHLRATPMPSWSARAFCGPRSRASAGR